MPGSACHLSPAPTAEEAPPPCRTDPSSCLRNERTRTDHACNNCNDVASQHARTPPAFPRDCRPASAAQKGGRCQHLSRAAAAQLSLLLSLLYCGELCVSKSASLLFAGRQAVRAAAGTVQLSSVRFGLGARLCNRTTQRPPLRAWQAGSSNRHEVHATCTSRNMPCQACMTPRPMI